MCFCVSGESFPITCFSRFARQSLSVEDAERRIELLYRAKQRLEENRPLSLVAAIEYDTREIVALEKLLYGELSFLSKVKIKRNFPGQYYFVKVTDNQNEVAAKRLRSAIKVVFRIQKAIDAIGDNQEIKNQGTVFLAQIKAMKKKKYHQAVTAHEKRVLGSEFFRISFKEWFFYQNFLKLTKRLKGCENLYKGLLKLCVGFLALYESEDHFNKISQFSILVCAEQAQKTALATCNLFGRNFSNLEVCVDNFEEKYLDILDSEIQSFSSFDQKIVPERSNIKEKIRALKSKATECMVLITERRTTLEKRSDDCDVDIQVLASLDMELRTFDRLLEEKQMRFHQKLELVQQALGGMKRIEEITPVSVANTLYKYKDRIVTAHAICNQLEEQCFLINQQFAFSIHQLFTVFPQIERIRSSKYGEKTVRSAAVMSAIKDLIQLHMEKEETDHWIPSNPERQNLVGWGPHILRI